MEDEWGNCRVTDIGLFNISVSLVREIDLRDGKNGTEVKFRVESLRQKQIDTRFA